MPYDRHRAEATILLGDRPVGILNYQGRQTTFEYTDFDPLHPVLGQIFETDPVKRRHSRSGVPVWFANLLPEPGSGLRLLLEADMGETRVHDFRLLVHIGADLAGAVRVVPGAGCDEVSDGPNDSDTGDSERPGGLRFSLAGVQRKLSMIRRGTSLVLAAHGQGGDVLVKFQDGDLEQVPQNEFTMMTWAGASGLTCAATELKGRSDLDGLPEGLWASSETVLAVDRFDRGPASARVHQEDLAQVWDVKPAQKYLDDDSLLNRREDGSLLIGMLIAELCPPEDVLEYVRRLAASAVMGNADMHLKNWSLVYPEGRATRLSPAYDLVCVTAYPGVHGRLAFPIGGEWDPGLVGAEHFRRLGDRMGQDPDVIARTARVTADQMAATWPTIRRECPVPEFLARHIDERLITHPLLTGRTA